VLKQFELNISKNTLFSKTDKLLVAFSGGVDSVVLADLLYKAGHSIELAHCNFQLRGNEANDDTAFCENFAKSISAPFHVIYVDTKTYASEHKLSIQMAARELRYDWFKDLKAEHHFDYILTAHHANDNIETLLVNLIRGTGIKGLQGIPEKQNDMVRPLLFATKEEIRAYAVKNKLAFREDSSNQEVKYKRNFIRHHVIPQLKTLNPSLEATIHSSVQFFKQSSDIVSEFAKLKFSQICKEKNDLLQIDIALLKKEPQKETLLFEWLYPKGFKTNQIEQLSEVLMGDKNIGKLFSSATHQLVVDRHNIFIKPITIEQSELSYTIHSISDTSHLPIKLMISETLDKDYSLDANAISISTSSLLFPLTLRHWKQGDKFKPFGMKGFKKLSDFFKDQKLSRFEKEQVWILENPEHIIWIVGYRLDDRCRINEDEHKAIEITVELSN
jgi:tRNA(Ile)-lysidine synthase